MSSGNKFSMWVHDPKKPDLNDPKARPIVMSPLLIASKNDIILLQPEQGTDARVTPVIAIEQPMKQVYLPGEGQNWEDPTAIHPSFTKSNVDRISFHTVINELGILLVGSPAGRVAVFSLLRTDDWLVRPEGAYFMRLDWLLPLSSQEDRSMRPETRLLGMTAGPVQGQLGATRPEVRRRWRLMLYYADHSILSYELGLSD